MGAPWHKVEKIENDGVYDRVTVIGRFGLVLFNSHPVGEKAKVAAPLCKVTSKNIVEKYDGGSDGFYKNKLWWNQDFPYKYDDFPTFLKPNIGFVGLKGDNP